MPDPAAAIHAHSRSPCWEWVGRRSCRRPAERRLRCRGHRASDESWVTADGRRTTSGLKVRGGTRTHGDRVRHHRPGHRNADHRAPDQRRRDPSVCSMERNSRVLLTARFRGRIVAPAPPVPLALDDRCRPSASCCAARRARAIARELLLEGAQYRTGERGRVNQRRACRRRHRGRTESLPRRGLGRERLRDLAGGQASCRVPHHEWRSSRARPQ